MNLENLDLKINQTDSPMSVTFSLRDNDDITIEEILTGLYFLKRSFEIGPELDEILKNKEQPEYLIMAFTEIKRLVDETRKDGIEFAQNFLSQKDSDSK